MAVSTQNEGTAEALKAAANQLFQAGRYADAVEKYTEALQLNASDPSYWTNRSFAYLKLELFGSAITDANQALALNPACVKAYYRRASANIALRKFRDALKDLRMVAKYAPKDQDARRKLQEVEKMVRQQEFERALAYDAPVRSVLEQIHLESIEVEQNYEGKRWDCLQAPLTRAFVDDMIHRFLAKKRIHRKYAYQIMCLAKKLFDAQPSLVHVSVPPSTTGMLTVCGDVHGQYYDLVNIFKLNGYPSDQHAYLFNGDFVDRGEFSAEVILTLFAFKVLYPNSFFLSRGNHETDNMNEIYGFKNEIKTKYSESMFKLFSEIFNGIPLCYVINHRVFVVHGGLFSRDDVTLADIEAIDRFRQPPDEGIMCEMLWADPQPGSGRSESKRGVGLQFGPDVTENFCQLNNLDIVVRSHEMCKDGYVLGHNGKCVTLFSAPDYCGIPGNLGAFLNIKRSIEADPMDCERPQLHYQYETFGSHKEARQLSRPTAWV